MNIGVSVLVIADLWYFRANGDFLGIKNILFKDTFNPLGRPLYNFNTIDLIFIVDIAVIILWIIIKKTRNLESRDISKFWFSLKHSIIMILVSFIALDGMWLSDWDAKLVKKGWDVVMSSKAPGPIGYHLVEAVQAIDKKLNKVSTSGSQDIEDWFKYNNEEIEPNEYEGVLQGKNVVFLQVESLENFVINKSTNGKEIMPFLNEIAGEGLYFNNFYEQNNAGNSIDCDFLVNASVLPLENKITALNYGENIYPNSLPNILNKKGYTTISSHAEQPGEFNWTELHKNSFGTEKLWDIRDYEYEETVGYGLSDKSLLTQIANKIENEKQPFFIQAATLSSHGPFNIDEKYRELDLPEEIDSSKLGGYFESLRYTDNQIKMFFNKLEESKLLDNTVVVIYGDHSGVHKYYNEEIEKLNYEDNWWKEYNHSIPLIIYSKGISPKSVETYGGQVDILPTISYLMGIDENLYKNTSMGRVLVNTNRNATVIKRNTIVGQVKDEEEKEHLLDAYLIGEKIIKGNYFSRK
jgi:phosphoglycerol transferase MdoB-like AlkP superfamily enzyme